MEGREGGRKVKALTVLAFLLDPNQHSPAAGPKVWMQTEELKSRTKQHFFNKNMHIKPHTVVNYYKV